MLSHTSFIKDIRESQEGNELHTLINHAGHKHADTHTHTPTQTHTHLAVLWCVEDVHSAGFDAVGLGPSVQSKAALSAPTVSAWKGAIVPEERQTKTNTGWKRKRGHET